jgi:hypothetical protein
MLLLRSCLGKSQAVTAGKFKLLELAEKNKQAIRSVEMNFINNSFWLRIKAILQFTPIAKRK